MSVCDSAHNFDTLNCLLVLSEVVGGMNEAVGDAASAEEELKSSMAESDENDE